MIVSRTAERKDEGFVLIAVAGLLLLLAVIASSLMLAARSELKARSARGAHVEIALFADGLLNLAAARLATQRASGETARELPVDGSPIRCQDGNIIAEITIHDTAGLIDLNATPPPVMQLLLQGVGVEAGEAARLAAAIHDFRDADGTPAVGGAEEAEYQQAGLAHGPKNASFESVDELDQVAGMTPELLERLRPYLTVHSRAIGIDPGVAPRTLLHLLSRVATGSDVADPENLERRRFPLPPQVVRRTVSRGSRSRLPTMVVGVRVAGGAGAHFFREATVELTAQSPSGFMVREWKARPVAGLPPMPTSVARPCLPAA